VILESSLVRNEAGRYFSDQIPQQLSSALEDEICAISFGILLSWLRSVVLLHNPGAKQQRDLMISLYVAQN